MTDVGARREQAPPHLVRLARFALFFGVMGTFGGRVAPMGKPIAAVGFLCVAAMLLSPRFMAHVKVPFVLFAWIGITGATVMWSVQPGQTVSRMVTVIGYVAIGMIAGATLSLDRIRRIIGAAGRVTILISFVTIAAIPSWAVSPEALGADGWTGIALHKNQFGFVGVLTLVCAWFDRRSRSRILWLLVSLTAIVGSLSSTSLVLVILFLVYLSAFGLLGAQASPRRRNALMFSGSVFAVVVLFVGANNVPFLTGLIGRDPTLTGRTDIWSTVIETAAKQPVGGYGFNSVWPDGDLEQTGGTPISREVSRRAGFPVVNAHSGYLDVFIGAGLVGLAVAIWILATIGRRSAQLPTSMRRDALWAGGVLLVFVVDSVSESNFALGFVIILHTLAMALVQLPVRSRLRVPTMPKAVVHV